MNISVVPVHTASQQREFIALPWILHAKDPNWVPPLRSSVKKVLNSKKHPFYKQAELKLWIAYRNNRPVGRIAAIVNHAHNEFHNEKIMFWGFFETDNCRETVVALFAVVEEWAKQKNIHCLKGPVSPSMNYECGMQISAFETKPYIMMTQNPSYYPMLIESLGHTKGIDIHAWRIHHTTINLHPKLDAIKQKLLKNSDIAVRPINMRNYYQEVELFLNIYNEAWEKNWGFVPLNNDELYHFAREMKPLVIPELTYFITVKGEPAACAICLPDINQVLAKNPSGKLFPLGFFKLLSYLKGNSIGRQGRIPLLGIRKKFRHLQLGILLYAKYGEICATLNMGNIECSWILESNKAMNFGLKHMNAEQYKTYRLYEKNLLNKDIIT